MMDSYELSKIAGAVFAALLTIFIPKTIIEMRGQGHRPAAPGYVLPSAEPAAAPEASADAKGKTEELAAKPDGSDATAKADAPAAKPDAAAAKGEAAAAGKAPAAKPDASAATAKADAPAPAAGGAGVLGLLAAASPENGKAAFSKCASCHTVTKGGANSLGPNLWGIVGRKIGGHEGFGYSAALKKMGEEGAVWDYESLAAWIQADDKFIPGNKMIFPGMADPAKQADVVAYLRSLSETPAPLPK